MPPKDDKRPKNSSSPPPPSDGDEPDHEVGVPARARGEFHNSDKVQARLEPYIASHKGDFDYYARLVKENPERAVRTLMLRDCDMFNVRMKRVNRQMPFMKEFYAAQPEAVRKAIDDKIAAVNPYHHDQAFVGEVRKVMDQQSNSRIYNSKPGEGTAAAASMSAGSM